jgi:hypothetical protein
MCLPGGLLNEPMLNRSWEISGAGKPGCSRRPNRSHTNEGDEHAVADHLVASTDHSSASAPSSRVLGVGIVHAAHDEPTGDLVTGARERR